MISCNNYKGTLCATRNANLPSTCSYASSSTTTGREGQGGGPDFAGQSCVERAGLMDLLRWRHVDMPRARVQVGVQHRVRVLRPSRTPLAISCSLFYGSLVLKLEVPADGRSAGVASCKWKGWQWSDGAGVRTGGRGPGLMATTILFWFIFANYRKARATKSALRALAAYT